MSPEARLAELESRVRRGLRHLGLYPRNWVLPTPGVDHDVFVLGGGQSGLSVSFALKRAGILNHTVVDQAPEGETGLWLTRARMTQMHTPKTVQGLDQGIPELSYPAWHEALYGEESYAQLWRIQRVPWGEYVRWFQKVLEIPVRYRVRLVEIERDEAGGFFRLHLVDNGVAKVETARKIVFANGVQGTGLPYTAPVVRGLPASLCAHTADHIDFGALRGKSVGILGAGSSALDAAGTALEHGAAEVHLFSRRPEMEFQGPDMPRSAVAPDLNYLLPDADRWRTLFHMTARGPRPPLDSLLRATAFPNFFLHFDAPWNAAAEEGGRVAVDAADGRFEFDFVVAATGFQYDPRIRPELKRVAHHIALWQDKFQPPPGQESASLGVYPYVGHLYEFQEKVPGTAPWIGDIHCYNKAALINYAQPVSSMSGTKAAVARMVGGIVQQFFLADLPRRPKPPAPPPPEDHRDKYAHAVWRPERHTAAVRPPVDDLVPVQSSL